MKEGYGRIQFMAPNEECDEIREKADKAGMTVNSFIRNALRGTEVREKPERDVPLMIMEIRRTGELLRILLEKEEYDAGGYADRIREALEQCRKAERLIEDSYGVRCP